MAPVGIALLGAGTFARDAYAGVLGEVRAEPVVLRLQRSGGSDGSGGAAAAARVRPAPPLPLPPRPEAANAAAILDVTVLDSCSSRRRPQEEVIPGCCPDALPAGGATGGRPQAMARGSLRVEAVWSRTEGPARALAAQLQTEVPGCAPEAFHGESGLQAILEGGSVEAVIIVLAAHIQVEVAKKALMSGNHVLSEKPLGLGPAEAWGAIRWYEALPCAPVWHVAENYRFERAYDRALGLVAGADADRPLGAALKLDLVADCPMTPENKYFQVRPAPAHRGGRTATGAPPFVPSSSL